MLAESMTAHEREGAKWASRDDGVWPGQLASPVV